MSAVFHHTSIRSYKARVRSHLTKAWLTLLAFASITLAVSGIALIVIDVPLGWVLVGISAIPAMIVEWSKGELQHLTLGSPDTIDGVLEADVLGLLPPQPSPYDIASILASVQSAQFFAARFGIGPLFLQEITSKDPKDIDVVWQTADQIKQELGLSTISGGVLLIALTRLYPHHEALLAHLQLNPDDLTEGLRWQQRINGLIDKHAQPMYTGGIARDWSYGWIPTLSRFGQNISQRISSGGLLSTELEAHSDALAQLIKTLSSKGKGSPALIGPDGVGKTQIVHALAATLLDAKSTIAGDLKFHQVFMLDASSLISAAPGRGELEGLLTQLLGEAYAAKNIIVCLDNAQLFFEEGIGSVDLSNTILPVIQAGRLPIVLVMDEQRFLEISARNSQIANALNRIVVAPSSGPETVAVMQDQLIVIEFSQNVTYMYQALQESYRLSERYINDIAMPGRALKLLELSAGYAEDGLVTALSVQQAIEKTMGIKVSNATDSDERDKLLHLEDLIHERMINQTKAVSVVSDALRRARAGVRNQNRPIGTFMFLGPTGVGKTELAKALADVYFGGEDRVIRLDMNEFVSSNDVMRLIADAADDGNSLTAQVMKQPFSVVLLDEIEKAHPNVLTTFLQLLDEGILRDVKNREVSFRDAIVIATSNAGADRIREYLARGMKIEEFEDQFVDELIASNQFKPEFLNRFDEIVMFRPLSKDELLQVVDLILVGVNKTLALQKVSVTVSAEAKQYLVDAGYDPRLGARPMRRVVQRAVENTVAKQVLSGAVGAGGVVEITLDQVQALVRTKKQADEVADAAA